MVRCCACTDGTPARMARKRVVQMNDRQTIRFLGVGSTLGTARAVACFILWIYGPLFLLCGLVALLGYVFWAPSLTGYIFSGTTLLGGVTLTWLAIRIKAISSVRRLGAAVAIGMSVLLAFLLTGALAYIDATGVIAFRTSAQTTNVFRDAAEGLSFHYPSSWSEVPPQARRTRVMLHARDGSKATCNLSVIPADMSNVARL